ncbi:MAG: hypothetical protein HZA90_04615 [Verrucomicrobia bacterium]|nr:hypothetical protein [Verrucomicrobiota bacterium]
MLKPADVDSPSAGERLSPQPGLPPAWAAWREGRYAERPAVFAALWTAFNEWRHRVTIAPPATPAVFCLYGRSGDGKSVLLLQLAAAALREGALPALQLYERKPDAREFTTPPATDTPWHFVDRLPDAVHGEDGHGWLKALRQQQPCFVVTTASPAALDWLTKKYPHHFAVTTWNLPWPQREEVVALAEALWGAGSQKEREALNPQPSTLNLGSVWREGLSLVEFLFAARHGVPLEQWAELLPRLVEPLRLESLREVWAANVLGLPAPASLLPPASHAEALRLAAEGLLPVQLSTDGLRLAPPRLARPVLEKLLPDPAERFFTLTEGFTQFVELWLKENNPAAAARFLWQMVHSEPLEDLFHRSRRRDVFRAIYEHHRAQHGERPAAALLAVWMDIGQVFRLKPDSLEDAAALLEAGPASNFTPELATEAWLHADRRKNPLAERLQRAAVNCLRQCKQDISGCLVRLYGETKHSAAALPVLRDWLEQHTGHPRAAAVLEALLQKPFGQSQLYAWAMDLVDWTWTGRTAGPLLAVLLDHHRESHALRQHALTWLQRYPATPQAGPLLLQLLRAGLGEPEVVRVALLWGAQFYAHPAATELWPLLLKHHSAMPEVRQVALEWVRHCPEHPQAAEMLLVVAREQRPPAELAPVVEAWLVAHPWHERAPDLLEALAPAAHEAVRPVLARWLDTQPRHASAAQMLAACLRSHLTPDWLARVKEFVLHSGHPDAARVLQRLLAIMPNDEVLRLAVEFLPRVPPAAQGKLARHLGHVAARQPERIGVLRQWPLAQPPLAAPFFAALAETALDMMAKAVGEWAPRVLPRLSDADLAALFEQLLAQTAPLPDPLSRALGTWLDRNRGKPEYRRMIEQLRAQPAQGHFMRSAGFLSLRAQADLFGAELRVEG